MGPVHGHLLAVPVGLWEHRFVVRSLLHNRISRELAAGPSVCSSSLPPVATGGSEVGSDRGSSLPAVRNCPKPPTTPSRRPRCRRRGDSTSSYPYRRDAP